MKNYTPLWREARFEVKMYKTHHVRTTFGSCDVEKVHAVVARSTFPSENVQKTSWSDHFWRFRLHYTTLHYSTLHYTTLQLQLHNYTPLHSTTLNYATLHYTTLHSTTLQLQLRLHNYTPLHEITLHYITLHYIPLHYTTLHYTTLH